MKKPPSLGAFLLYSLERELLPFLGHGLHYGFIHEDAAAMLAHDDLFVACNVQLTLGRNGIEAPAAAAALYRLPRPIRCGHCLGSAW
jgi:hypothetical protein